MENSYKKNSHKNNRENKYRSNSNQSLKGKAKKKGRTKQAPISGFSTLSQVSGAPIIRSYHSSIPVLNPKTVIEPYPVCTICSNKIETIADSFSYNDGYAHFDCIINLLKEREVLKENETISYVGSGSFAICLKNEDGTYSIEKKIEIENKDTFLKSKNYVESLKQ